MMPALQGTHLRDWLLGISEHIAVALDVNEAFDDASGALPLGAAPYAVEADGPFEPVAVLHCNLEEAAACLNRKGQLLSKAAAAAGVGASTTNLEAWIDASDLEELATELTRRGAGIVLITLGANGAYAASTADEARLRRLLRHACPPELSAIARQRGRLVPAFAPLGAVNSVGAGDSFLAGVVAALCCQSLGQVKYQPDLRAGLQSESRNAGAQERIF